MHLCAKVGGLFMTSLISAGGFIMYPLLICSIVIWAVVIEKFWFIYSFSHSFKGLNAQIKELVKTGKIHEAKGLCLGAPSVLIAPYEAIFENVGTTTTQWEQRVGRRFQESVMEMGRFMWILGTIGASAPFVGLFGTVIGIIKSFTSISESGKSGFSVVAAGLSEALIATATGIIVAVIAIVFYNFFQVRLRVISARVKNGIDDLMEIISVEK
jgi:biopolymer transport protein ExbB/TolQ